MKTPTTLLALLLFLPTIASADENSRPNILWITSEDNGPQIGAYGDDFAVTPNIDRIAATGMRYTNAWSTAPVCAPARTTIISGMYPPSTGSEHMRSMARLPDGFKMYPQYLREAGYYCTNNSKEDYNLEKPGEVWDESSGRGHWRNRKPGQPFFAIFNFTSSHESKIRSRPHTLVHDPDKVPIPAYHPDTPEVRHDWAQYYDIITQMDAQVGGIVAQLKEDGLEEETIVFYYGDHGSGMPRSKRWPYNSGLQVPMIVSVPKKFKDLAPAGYTVGGESDRLVGFIDLAPTLLSIVGIEPPPQMQGHAFLGKYETPEQPFAYGFRGRMDERYDMIRVVRDKRYLYIRNYNPHKIYGQHVGYMFVTPTTRVWKELFDAGKLNPTQAVFWGKKPAEELYDLANDPDEVNNLAASPAHQEIKERLKRAQQAKVLEIRDVGFLAEGEIHERSAGSTPYEMAHDPAQYPLERILATAEAASSLEPEATPGLIEAFGDEDSGVRYWAAMGILMRETEGLKAAKRQLTAALDDESPYVRSIAAQALGQFGNDRQAARALDVLLELAPIDTNGPFVSMLALNAIDIMDDRAKGAKDILAAMPRKASSDAPARVGGYSARLLEKILADLE